MAQISPGSALIKAINMTLSLDPAVATWIAGDRLLFGTYPTAKWVFDFGAERMADVETADQLPAPPKPPSETARIFDEVGGRHTGDYWLTVLDRKGYFQSGKALLMGGLKAIEAARPGTLDKLTKYRPRTKRVVARRPEDLYEFPDSMAKFVGRLSPEWFVATNNSFREIKGYLRRATQDAGLEWDKDVILRIHS